MDIREPGTSPRRGQAIPQSMRSNPDNTWTNSRHGRSSFCTSSAYNLGAYSTPLEAGLLIPSRKLSRNDFFLARKPCGLVNAKADCLLACAKRY